MNVAPLPPGWRVRPVAQEDRSWIEALLIRRWGSTALVSRGRIHDGARLPGFVVVRREHEAAHEPPRNSPQDAIGTIVGLATYRLQDAECELVSLDSLSEGRGVGTVLIEAVRDVARAAGCRRLWLVTTNDNLPAQRFYAHRGLRLAQVHRGAVAESRRLKPGIPAIGLGGVPIEDELEYEMIL